MNPALVRVLIVAGFGALIALGMDDTEPDAVEESEEPEPKPEPVTPDDLEAVRAEARGAAEKADVALDDAQAAIRAGREAREALERASTEGVVETPARAPAGSESPDESDEIEPEEPDDSASSEGEENDGQGDS